MQLKCEIEVTNESLEQHFCCNVLTFADVHGIEEKKCKKHSLPTPVTKQIQRQDKNNNEDLKTKEKTKTKSEGQLKDITNYVGHQL